jgi:hypothetical protein
VPRATGAHLPEPVKQPEPMPGQSMQELRLVPQAPLLEQSEGLASMATVGQERPDKKRHKRRESGSGKQPVS